MKRHLEYPGLAISDLMRGAETQYAVIHSAAIRSTSDATDMSMSILPRVSPGLMKTPPAAQRVKLLPCDVPTNLYAPSYPKVPSNALL